MMRNFTGEFAVSLGLLALLFVIFNPWNILMPGYVVMSLLIAIVVLFAIFTAFIWREQEGDEREHLHRLFADRVAYLTVSTILLVSIVVQEFQHALDPWLIFSLGAMLIGKVAGLVYSKIKW